jgi:IBR domain, a half RING-finger domain
MLTETAAGLRPLERDGVPHEWRSPRQLPPAPAGGDALPPAPAGGGALPPAPAGGDELGRGVVPASGHETAARREEDACAAGGVPGDQEWAPGMRVAFHLEPGAERQTGLLLEPMAGDRWAVASGPRLWEEARGCVRLVPCRMLRRYYVAPQFSLPRCVVCDSSAAVTVCDLGLHASCLPCLRSWLSVRLREAGHAQARSTTFRCPGQECAGAVTDAWVLAAERSADPELALAFAELNSGVRRLPDYAKCPRDRCDGGGIVGADQRDAQCPRCDRCWTLPTAEPARSAGDTRAHIQRICRSCPGCGVGIERTHGCPRMSCTQCRFEFCWVCLGAWRWGGGHEACLSQDATEDATATRAALRLMYLAGAGSALAWALVLAPGPQKGEVVCTMLGFFGAAGAHVTWSRAHPPGPTRPGFGPLAPATPPGTVRAATTALALFLGGGALLHALASSRSRFGDIASGIVMYALSAVYA